MLRFKGKGYRASIDLTHIEGKSPVDSVEFKFTIRGKEPVEIPDYITFLPKEDTLFIEKERAHLLIADKEDHIRFEYLLPLEVIDKYFLHSDIKLLVPIEDRVIKMRARRKSRKRFYNAIEYWLDEVAENRSKKTDGSEER